MLAIHKISELQDYIVNNLYLSSSSNETWIFFVQGKPIKSLERVEGSTFLVVVCSPSSLSGNMWVCWMFGCPDTA